MLTKIEKEHCKTMGITETELKNFQKEYLKAEKEGRIVPIEIDANGYPYAELETEGKK